jgi:hypothetical protein
MDWRLWAYAKSKGASGRDGKGMTAKGMTGKGMTGKGMTGKGMTGKGMIEEALKSYATANHAIANFGKEGKHNICRSHFAGPFILRLTPLSSGRGQGEGKSTAHSSISSTNSKS